MTGGMQRRAVPLVESTASGTGRLLVRAARETGYAPVPATAKPETYAYLAGGGADEDPCAVAGAGKEAA